MSFPSDLPRVLRFGLFEVDLGAHELRRNGDTVLLQLAHERILHDPAVRVVVLHRDHQHAAHGRREVGQRPLVRDACRRTAAGDHVAAEHQRQRRDQKASRCFRRLGRESTLCRNAGTSWLSLYRTC